MKQSIASKITLVAVLCGLIPTLLAIGYNVFTVSRRQALEVQQAGQYDLADRKALVEGQVQKFKEILVTTAVNPAFVRYFRARDEAERAVWRLEAEKAVAHLTGTFKGMIDESCFLGAGGAELVRVTFGEPAPPEDLSADESGAEFFSPALAADQMEVVVAGPYVSPDSNRPVLAFATPILDGAGKRLAVLHMEVPLAYFQKEFAGLDSGGTRTMLVDQQGQILVRGDRPVLATGKFQPLAQAFGISRAPAGMTAVRADTGSWLVYGAEIPELKKSIVIVRPDNRRQVMLLQLVQPLAVAGVALLFMALGAYALSRRVARPIQQLAASATALAQGDTHSVGLITGIRTGDETELLAQSFLKVSQAFHGLVENLAQASQVVEESNRHLEQSVSESAHAIQRAGAGIQSFADTALEQVAALQETGEQIGDVRKAIEQVAGGAESQAVAAGRVMEAIRSMSTNVVGASEVADRVRRAAEEAHGFAREGARVVGKVAEDVAEVSRKVERSRAQVVELASMSDRIEALTATIDDVLRQTNLLALNAAIEAARAGSAGQGFAVVAEEVRRLAEQVGVAADEIAGVVSGIRQQVSAMVRVMEDSAQTVHSSADLAGTASTALSRTVEAVEEAGRDVAAIADQVHALSAASREINQAMSEVSAVAEENSASSEEMFAASEAVNDQVRRVIRVTEENAGRLPDILADQGRVGASVEQVAAQARALAEAGQSLREVLARFSAPGHVRE